MKVTEKELVNAIEARDIIEAIIADLERPTKNSRARVEEWLEKHPYRLRDILNEFIEPMVKEVYPVYPVGVEQNKAS